MCKSRRRSHQYLRWSLILLLVITGEPQQEPWLPGRMLEFPISRSGAPDVSRSSEQHHLDSREEVFTVRFDALLVTPTQLANRILPVPVAKPTDGGEIPLEINETNAWQEQRAEDARKVISAATDTLRRAPDPVYDEMEAEMVLAAGRGVRGDWLENADSTCEAQTAQRRQEIIKLYRDGTMDRSSMVCGPLAAGDEHGTPSQMCEPSPAAKVAAKLGLTGETLMDSTSCLLACRTFNDMTELEYSKAACLRAVRLGGMSQADYVEADMRLAYVAQLHGQPANAGKLYYGIMGRSTNYSGRLAVSILALTMVPPELIGSPQTVVRFREDWTNGLQTLARSLREGDTKVRGFLADLSSLRSWMLTLRGQGQLWDPNAQMGSTPFHLAHQGGPDLRLMSALAGVYDAAAPSLRFIAPHCDEHQSRVGTAKSYLGRRPDRIGFFSLHLRDHSIGRMMGLLMIYLSENPDLEIHAFGPQGSNPLGEGDLVVNALRGAVHWHQAPQGFDDAIRAVSQQQLDVLVYPDIGMYSLTYFMAFARLAPVQCVWWGHPVTTSTGAIDFFLSLDAELDGGQADYLEQMVRMEFINTATFTRVQPLREPPEPPDCNTNRLSSPAPVFFQAEEHGSSETSRPTSQIDKAMELERRDQDNATIGVTVSERLRCADSSKSMRSCHRTYVVFGRLFKLHHDFDLTIEGIIAGDLNGCVILIHEKQDEAWTRAVWARLIRKLRSKGLSERLRIINYWSHQEALRRASVVLDTFPYGGCLTVLEGLSHGVPVVTLPADFIRGRFALAIYRQMGYTGLVAEDLEGYVDLALKLGMDNAFREHALAEMETGYRSLNKNAESAAEWGRFFQRALRAARF